MRGIFIFIVFTIFLLGTKLFSQDSAVAFSLRHRTFLKTSLTQLIIDRCNLSAECFLDEKISGELKVGIGSLGLTNWGLGNKVIAECEISGRYALRSRIKKRKSLPFLHQVGFRVSYVYAEYKNRKYIYYTGGSEAGKYYSISGYWNVFSTSANYTFKVRLRKLFFMDSSLGVGTRSYRNQRTYLGRSNGEPLYGGKYPYPYTLTIRKTHFWPYVDVSVAYIIPTKKSK